MSHFFIFIGRLALAQIFILSGVSKIFNYVNVGLYMESKEVLAILLPVVIFVELAGGILLVVGFLARYSAFSLAAFSILAALLFHNDFSQTAEMIAFQKNIAIAGGLLAITGFGAGYWSIDGLINNGQRRLFS